MKLLNGANGIDIITNSLNLGTVNNSFTGLGADIVVRLLGQLGDQYLGKATMNTHITGAAGSYHLYNYGNYPFTYYYRSGTLAPISGHALATGYITKTPTSSLNNIVVICEDLEIENVVSIKEINSTNSVQFFPIPISNILKIENVNLLENDLILYDYSGRIVNRFSKNTYLGGEISIDLPNGIYFIRGKYIGGTFFNEKIVVVK